MALRSVHPRFLLAAFTGLLLAAQAVSGHGEAPVTVEQIMEKVAENDRERSADLASYSGKRTYNLRYQGFLGSRNAEMVVEMQCRAPATKEFRVVRESGSKLILNYVLHALLAGEQEAQNAQNRQETALTADNYDFLLEREESDSDHHYYVVEVKPRRKNKFLYRGRVWIEAKDFALARIDAEPARNPSFWISRTSIHHQYIKVNKYWLPAQNVSRTNVRLGGVATLTINYGDYAIPSQPDPIATLEDQGR